MSRKEILYSICPICLSGKIFYWHHGTGIYENKFASSNETHNGNLYIYDDGTIECDACHQRDNIKNWKFNCGDCDNHYYYEPSKMRLARMLYSMSRFIIDENFIDDVLSNVF